MLALQVAAEVGSYVPEIDNFVWSTNDAINNQTTHGRKISSALLDNYTIPSPENIIVLWAQHILLFGFCIKKVFQKFVENEIKNDILLCWKNVLKCMHTHRPPN